MASDPTRPFCLAADRNKIPILKVLERIFTEPGCILEIGSGTGQHAAYFAAHLPHVIWQATELASALPGIEAWRREAMPANLPPPLALDVHRYPWPVARVDGAFSANTAHILSWEGVECMFFGLSRVVAPGGLFCLYGPFNEGAAYTSEGNAQLDAWLRAQDPASGLRDIGDISALAIRTGFGLVADHGLPANNRLLVWRRVET